MKRSVILSHLMVSLLGGGLAWKLLLPEKAASPDIAPTATLAKRKVTTPAELLDRLTEKTRKESDAAVEADMRARIKRYTEAFEKLPDIEARCHELAAKLQSSGALEILSPGDRTQSQNDLNDQLTAALIVWIGRDPAHAMASHYFHDLAFRFVVRSSEIRNAFKDTTRKGGFSATLQILASLNPGTAREFYDDVLTVVAENGSYGELMRALQEIHERGIVLTNMCLPGIISSWPLDKKDELISSIPKDFQESVIENIVDRMPIKDGASWLQDLMEKGTLDEAQILSFRGKLEAKLHDDKDTTPFDEKVAILKSFSGGEDFNDSQAATDFAVSKIQTALGDDDKDYLYRYRKQQISAQEILDEICAKTGDPGSARQQLRDELAVRLPDLDSTELRQLIKTQNRTEDQNKKLGVLSDTLETENPERFYRCVSSIMDQNDPALKDAITDQWSRRTESSLEIYGDSYVDWAAALPDPTQRLMALEAIQSVGMRKNPSACTKASLLLEGH